MNKLQNKKLQSNHESLSSIGLEFVRYAVQSADFEQPLPVASSAEPLYAQEYPFALQPMPIFLTREMSQFYANIGVGVFAVYKKLVLRLVKDNPALLDEYFESTWPKSLVELLSGHTGIDYCLLRGDFTATDDGFKLMEFNVSGNLGGWGIFLMENIYREYPGVKKFLAKHSDTEFTTYSPLNEMVKHVVGVSYQFTAGKTPNIGVWLEDTSRLSQAHDMFDRIKQMLTAQGVSVEFTAMTADSKLEEVDGKLMCEHRAIDSILLQGKPYQLPEFVHLRSERGELPIFNGRASNILHQKSGLALLSEYADWAECPGSEKKLIDSSVPWTRLLKPSNVAYQGKQYDLLELLTAEKDSFVIKPVGGSQGSGVSLGNRQSSEAWAELVEQCVAEGGYIVQQLCQSQQLLGRSQDGQFVPHDAVWAPFVFGGKFAGTCLRLQPSNDETGVINAHRGASDAIIFLHE